jgi:hypothetical protein
VQHGTESARERERDRKGVKNRKKIKKNDCKKIIKKEKIKWKTTIAEILRLGGVWTECLSKAKTLRT